jgi:gamma-butyrobetaine dioxygenase
MSKIIDKIIGLYTSYGDAKYGEDITQTEHAVQCAMLAHHENAVPELIVATLLHDIGHLLETADQNHGNFQHDKVGADFLSQNFGAGVSEPVRLHAQAKRYLCTVESHYHDILSEASKYSLKKQGGLMTTEEIEKFEGNPHFAAAVRLRRWDDLGKDHNLQLDNFLTYRNMMISLINQ